MSIFRVKPKVLLLFSLQILMCALCVISNNIKFGVIISLIQLIISAFTIYVLYGNLFTFGAVFLLLSYILHMGNLLSTQLFGSDNEYLYTLENSTINKGITFFVICHFMFTVGICWGENKGYISKLSKKVVINRDAFWRVGVVCTFIGIVPRIYIDYSQIKLQLANGYLESLSKGLNYGWMSILGQFFYVGILVLIFLSEDNKWRARIILISVSIWEAATMLSGGRIYAISMIVAMLYIYIIKIERPSFRKIILGVIVLYFLCCLLNAIALIRINGVFSVVSLKTFMFSFNSGNNPIISILDEMGSTFMSLGLAFDNIPSYHSYGYGKSYLSSILSVIPMYDSYIADIKDLFFIYAFKSNPYLGGSWLGETYYNFSWFGCLYSLVLGLFIGKFENIFKIDKENNSYLGSLFIVTFLFYIVTYIRDYFYHFTTTIQVFLVVVIMAYLLKHISFKISMKNYRL